MSITFRFETDGRPMTEIAHHTICAGAVFRLDRPMHCTVEDVFELKDGQWFLLTWHKGEKHRTPIEGRWVLPKVKLVPEKKMKKAARAVLVNVEAEDR